MYCRFWVLPVLQRWEAKETRDATEWRAPCTSAGIARPCPSPPFHSRPEPDTPPSPPSVTRSLESSSRQSRAAATTTFSWRLGVVPIPRCADACGIVVAIAIPLVKCQTPSQAPLDLDLDGSSSNPNRPRNPSPPRPSSCLPETLLVFGSVNHRRRGHLGRTPASRSTIVAVAVRPQISTVDLGTRRGPVEVQSRIQDPPRPLPSPSLPVITRKVEPVVLLADGNFHCASRSDKSPSSASTCPPSPSTLTPPRHPPPEPGAQSNLHIHQSTREGSAVLRIQHLEQHSSSGETGLFFRDSTSTCPVTPGLLAFLVRLTA